MKKLLPLIAICMFILASTACATPAQPASTSAPAPTLAPADTSAPTVAPTLPLPTQAPAARTPADTLVFVTDISDLITLDPAVGYEPSYYPVGLNVYESLLRFEGADLTTVKPGLAEKWAIADAGTNWTITFNLRTNAKFASGNPVTADDVVYSVQRTLTLNKIPASVLTGIGQMKADSVKAPDAKTVVFTLPKTASPQAFLTIAAFSTPMIVDSKEVKAHEQAGDSGSGWLLDHSAGSGPYVVDHWTKQTEVLLKANPNYAGTKPALSNILMKHVPEPVNQQSMIEKGDADIAQKLSPEQIAAEKGKPGMTIAASDSLIFVYFGFNTAVKPLDNPKVREALRMAVDYDGIVINLLSGNAKKLQGIVPPPLFGANTSTPFQANVDQAKALLKEAGVEQGFSTELLIAAGQAPGGVAWSDLASKLQADWAKIGVKVDVKQISSAEKLTIYRAQKHQIMSSFWSPDFPDPDSNVRPFTDFSLKTIAWRNSWDDSTIADKAGKAALMADPVARAAAYKDITDYVMHNGPYLILYQAMDQFVLRDNVKGFQWNPMGSVSFGSISK